MPSARHILIVNSRNVHQPVFVVGAPHSGADLIGRALKTSATFHVTMGQPSVLRVVYAFARRPSMYQGRTQAAATVIRDAFAQGWQVTPHSCLECTRECRAAAGLASDAVGPCVEVRGLERFGDASPDLIYCAEALTYAFPGARIIQVIRNGQDVVTRMLADPVVMSWFRPSFVNVDTEFPNPFFGIETEEDLELWPQLSPAARCALRWRWSVRLAARLHHSLAADQLKTISLPVQVRVQRTTTGWFVTKKEARCPGTQNSCTLSFTGPATWATVALASSNSWSTEVSPSGYSVMVASLPGWTNARPG